MKTLSDSRSKQQSTALRKLDALKITVLAGGPGMEREVSLHSGQAVFDALQRLGHHVTLRDIGPDDLTALDLPADFVFIALHGEFGEDGALQAELETRGRRYGGSGAAASRMAMNKIESKRRFERAGVPTPPYQVLDRANFDAATKRAVLPAVVKPVAAGSSVDTSIVRSREALAAAAALVVDRYGEALVERYIRGYEFTVGILGDEVLPVCEIRTKREFYDYQAKYIDDDTQYLFDLDVPATLLAEVQRVSLAAHRALGCRVFSRVDCMVDRETLDPFILEVNTIPGFTSHSLLPKAAARVGLSFDQLCQRIIELSWAEFKSAGCVPDAPLQ
jgi:D-alanine-D-alanine ligase